MAWDTSRSIGCFRPSTEPRPDTNLVILNNAHGTGTATFELLNLFPAAGSTPKIHAVDIALKMIEILEQKMSGTNT